MAAISLRKRTVALVMAVVLAALATLALISYVRGLESKAFAGVQMVQAYVAKDDIPVDTPADVALSRGLIEKTAMPRRVLAAGAVRSLDQIRGKFAAVTILKGEQIAAARFVSVADAGGILPIPAGRQAVAVQTDIPPAVGGFVRPGDHVSVLAKVDVPASGRSAAAAGATLSQVRFLLQDVAVLAVGEQVANRPQSAGSKDGEDAKASQQQSQILLTLAVTPSDAEKLAFAVLEGEIYFTLLPKGQRPVRTLGRTQATVFR